MLKCSSERCVCAPQSFSAGTSTTPILSVSLRTSVIALLSKRHQPSPSCYMSGGALRENGVPSAAFRRGLVAGRPRDWQHGERAHAALGAVDQHPSMSAVAEGP